MAHDENTKVNSYAWKIWWHKISFYVVPTYAPLSGVKVSLHGPDDRHPQPGFRIDIDRNAMRQAKVAGGIAHGPKGGVWFSGREMVPGVRHVITLRWTTGLFKKGVPSGPSPDVPRVVDSSLVVAAPVQGFASDVDVYVCQGRPWWREEAQARRDNACIGPLKNDGSEYLTAVSVRRRLAALPTPPNVRLASPETKGDKVRAIGSGVHDEVLFLVEQWTSRRRLQLHQDSLGLQQSRAEST